MELLATLALATLLATVITILVNGLLVAFRRRGFDPAMAIGRFLSPTTTETNTNGM
jgi:hypothetical protein